MWRWLYKQKLVDFSEEVIPVPKSDDKQHYPFVLEQEAKKIMNTFDEFYPDQLRDKAIAAFLYATGVRLSEMFSIDVSEINLEERKAVVKTFKRKNHRREIYWDQNTNELLGRWINVRGKIMGKAVCQSNALLISLSDMKYGKRICKDNVQRMFRNVRKQVGIEKQITAHSFQHGFGKKAVEKDVHPRHLQKMLGHAKLNTTMFYMGVADGELERVYRQKMEFAA